MTPGVAAAYLGMIISRPATGTMAGRTTRGARPGRLARAARAIAATAEADARNGAWKRDPCLVESDYYRLINQPRD